MEIPCILKEINNSKFKSKPIKKPADLQALNSLTLLGFATLYPTYKTIKLVTK